jgi:hypothetical protein
MLMWPVSTTDVFDEWFQVLNEEERAEIEAKVPSTWPTACRHAQRVEIHEHEGTEG